jgi:peptidoglycan/LPS O-acetylase OafA/YrhL
MVDAYSRRHDTEAWMSTTTALDEAGATSVDRPGQQWSGPSVGAARPRHPHIPSLDGLRFIAALNVMVAHGYWFIVLLQQDTAAHGAIANLLLSGAAIGMTLFFVLSGFVIHFNYHKTVPTGVSGKLDFFIARFARLYPLFLLVFGYDFFTLLWAQGYFSGYVFSLYDPFRALPQYLTFTQAWWWWPMGATSAYEYYGTWITGATGVMWSLSTEAFFYVSYLFCAGALSRLRGWRLAAFGAAVAVYGVAFYIFGWTHGNALKGWAAAHFPDSSPEQFMHWVLFQSPWGRISEFLLGVVAAQALLTRQGGGKSEGETESETGGSFAKLLTYGSAAAFVIVVVAIFARDNNSFSTIGTQCSAALVALFVYAVARYRSLLSGILSSPLFVAFGNASYSLYLLHYFILHDYGQRLVALHPGVSRWAIFLAMTAVALAVSYVSYVLIERPAIRWVRANFRPLRLAILLPTALTLVTLFSVLISIHMRALAHSDPAQAAGRISVASASFGENCSAKLHDNILGLMRRVCNGERSCAFDYDVEKIRDPAGGCDKSFQVLYSCGPGDGQREFAIPHFNRPRMRVAFACQ